jgi:hypothetical protein
MNTSCEGKNDMSTTYIEAVEAKVPFDWKRIFFLLLGIALFCIIYYSPPWPDAIDPMGKHFTLSAEGKGALALFALAATWWIFEVLPIGITGIAIGVFQAMFLIRKPEVAFKDFMDPSVLFIFGSIVIGLVFTKSDTCHCTYRDCSHSCKKLGSCSEKCRQDGHSSKFDSAVLCFQNSKG